jgi:hypothetical protein
MSDLVKLLTLSGDNRDVSYIPLIVLISAIVINGILYTIIINKKGGRKAFAIVPFVGLVCSVVYGYYGLVLKKNMDDSDVMFYSAGVATGTTILSLILSIAL